ncbi:hypothetical protein SEVIR_5G197000v4 [Setaria viridis]|uniref:Uncharacterized protein n=1 Tax=Setaria viridis TaxID=4556 RepID=A0A4U6UFY6_SETVI|nr:hypothetical protein SEVIR_5G197000v2 [Setaria viridis]
MFRAFFPPIFCRLFSPVDPHVPNYCNSDRGSSSSVQFLALTRLFPLRPPPADPDVPSRRSRAHPSGAAVPRLVDAPSRAPQTSTQCWTPRRSPSALGHHRRLALLLASAARILALRRRRRGTPAWDDGIDPAATPTSMADELVR